MVFKAPLLRSIDQSLIPLEFQGTKPNKFNMSFLNIYGGSPLPLIVAIQFCLTFASAELGCDSAEVPDMDGSFEGRRWDDEPYAAATRPEGSLILRSQGPSYEHPLSLASDDR